MYSKLDVLEAIRSLTPARLRRLKGFARKRVWGLRRKDYYYEDLLSEAIAATMEGRRTWRQGVDFDQHLMGAMRSISSSWRTRQGVEVNESELLDPESGGSPLDRASTSLDPSRILEAKEDLNRVTRLLANDLVAYRIIELMAQGCAGREIRGRLQISMHQYGAATKRIRRKLDVYFPELCRRQETVHA